MFRILAIDYGEKRIGIAITDPLQIIARPYKVLANDGINALNTIEEIIQTEKAGKVILGLPVNLAGEDTKKTLEVKEFATKLKSVISVPLEFWDERYTTDEAKKTIKKMNINTREARQIVDKIAASVILKDYLENHK
ncbi:MAG: Holliday junction resolvase RuvX [Candidatus Cloacimonetes bacterium]|nr:Holliday junction resolvase RuvX [Candidatus Cloacimonadota bacterium]MCF7813123.1 Holliday junction resolvase RuvX [Candidatus Cloacimonadota bacterium]MCF7867571.1 Holliday junction resolvase RuvX [Candidatus Cloacimonadota bacterium]MCF7883035.1 Holliday junction resolvase RuvX [Candidatus Cloacimonadota bacterium]